MRNGKRGRYTLEFKQEAVRLVESGQTMAAAARSLGVVEQTLDNWVKANRAGTLKGVSGKSGVTGEQMEISRLRAELARVTMERDILHPTDEDLSVGTPAWEKRRHTLQRARSEVCLYSTPQADLADPGAMPCTRGKRIRIPPTLGATPGHGPTPPS